MNSTSNGKIAESEDEMNASYQHEMTGSHKQAIVRFAVHKVKSYDTDVYAGGSRSNLLSSEYGEDDVFEGTDSRLDMQIAENSNSAHTRGKSGSISSLKFSKKGKQKRLKVLMVLLACSIITVVILVWHFYQPSNIVNIRDGVRVIARVDVKSKLLTVVNPNDQPILTVTLDTASKVSGNLQELQSCADTTSNGLCLNWPEANSSISITAWTFLSGNIQNEMSCVKVGWETSGPHVPKDCALLEKHQEEGSSKSTRVWFGSHEYVYGSKNCSNARVNVQQCIPFIPGGYSPTNPFGRVLLHGGGNVIEPVWFSSDGIAIKASMHHAVNVCNDVCDNSLQPTLCLEPIFDHTHQNDFHNGNGYHLDYMICMASSLPAVVTKMTERFLKPKSNNSDVPKVLSSLVNDGAFYEGDLEKNMMNDNNNFDAPPEENLLAKCKKLIKEPLWNFVYREDVMTEERVRVHLNPLKQFSGTILIENVTQIYAKIGDFKLRRDPYWSAETFVKTSREYDLGVMFPITLFINYDAGNFRPAAENSYFVFNEDNTAPLLTSLSIDKPLYPGIIDVTNTNATEWFIKEVASFMNRSSVDYAHFMYGQSAWLPHSKFSLQKPLHNVGHFSTLFTDIAANISTCSITDVAYDSQRRRQLVMLSSSIDLRQSLTAVLAAGLGGYPFFVSSFPYTLSEAKQNMSSDIITEALIRWIEMVSFFPVMHIPWDFQTMMEQKLEIQLILNVTTTYHIHRNSEEVWPKLQKAIRDAEINSSLPVVAPMWMAPGSLSADNLFRDILLIDDQFMVGPNMFVAPILDFGVDRRRIYIPPGKWRDVVDHLDVESKTGKWLNHYPVPLQKIPVFVRASAVLE